MANSLCTSVLFKAVTNLSMPFSICHTGKHLHETRTARTGRAAGVRILLEEGRWATCAAQLVSGCHISFSPFSVLANAMVTLWGFFPHVPRA